LIGPESKKKAPALLESLTSKRTDLSQEKDGMKRQTVEEVQMGVLKATRGR